MRRTLKKLVLLITMIMAVVLTGCHAFEANNKETQNRDEVSATEAEEMADTKTESEPEYFTDFQDYEFSGVKDFWKFESMPVGEYRMSGDITVVISDEDTGYLVCGDNESDLLEHPILTKEGLYGANIFRSIELQLFEVPYLGSFKSEYIASADVEEDENFSQIDILGEGMTFGYIGTEYSLYSKGEKLASIDAGEQLYFDSYPGDCANVRGESGNEYKLLVSGKPDLELVKIADDTEYTKGVYCYDDGNLKIYAKNGINYMVVPENEETIEHEGFAGLHAEIPEGKSLKDFASYKSIEICPENMDYIRFTYGGDNYAFRLMYYYCIGETEMSMDLIAEEIEKQYLCAVIPAEELEKWTTEKFESNQLQNKIDELNNFLNDWENDNEDYIMNFFSKENNNWVKDLAGAQEFLKKHN